MDLSSLRAEYESQGLAEEDALKNPVEQFRLWFDQAVGAGLPEPNAMVLATVSADGRPSARAVLMKDFHHEGVVFYTNYRSRKAEALTATDRASLLFLWIPLHRQVRIEGRVAKVPASVSDAYFATRPRGAQLAAAVSQQSAVVASRLQLEKAVEELDAAGEEITRPDWWGGYRLEPDEYEFWQGRPNRLHDRLRYRQAGDAWEIERLAP